MLQAAFTPSGSLLLESPTGRRLIVRDDPAWRVVARAVGNRVLEAKNASQRADIGWKRVPRSVVDFLIGAGIMEAEGGQGYTGDITDSLGRKYHYVNGERVAGQEHVAAHKAKTGAKVYAAKSQRSLEPHEADAHAKKLSGQPKVAAVGQGDMLVSVPAPATTTVPATVNGESATVVARDAEHGLAKVEMADGTEKTVKIADVQVAPKPSKKTTDEHVESISNLNKIVDDFYATHKGGTTADHKDFPIKEVERGLEELKSASVNDLVKVVESLKMPVFRKNKTELLSRIESRLLGTYKASRANRV